MTSTVSTQHRSGARTNTEGPVGSATASLRGGRDVATENMQQGTAVPLSGTDGPTEPGRTVRFVRGPTTM